MRRFLLDVSVISLRPTLLVASIIAMTAAPVAFGQENLTLKQKAEIKNEQPPGWSPALSLTGNLSFGSNDNVIGQQNGDTVTLGSLISGGYSYYSPAEEWRNTFKFSAATTKTPTIPRYVKSSDELKIESLYLNTLEAVPWLGPYVRLSAETTAFKGEDVREAPTTYLFTETGTTFTGSTLRLTDPFHPLTTKQSVGAFAKIIEESDMKLETRVGVGALQVGASDQYAVEDDSLTPEVDVILLRSYEQVGVEGGFTFSGILNENSTYNLSGDFLVPLINDLRAGDNRSTLELTNYELVAKLTNKINSWMNINYEYKLKKQPQLLDKNQIQHLLLLNLSYTIF